MVFIFLDFTNPPRQWGRGGCRFILYTTTDCFQNFILYHIIHYVFTWCTHIIPIYVCVRACVYDIRILLRVHNDVLPQMIGVGTLATTRRRLIM